MPKRQSFYWLFLVISSKTGLKVDELWKTFHKQCKLKWLALSPSSVKDVQVAGKNSCIHS